MVSCSFRYYSDMYFIVVIIVHTGLMNSSGFIALNRLVDGAFFHPGSEISAKPTPFLALLASAG